MSVNIRRLRVFATIAKTRSVTGAARQLNMTPPAVTKSLRELETTLTAELFHRSSSGMILTPCGETFLLHAERALSEIDHAQQAVAMMIGGEGGRIAIGATAEAAILVLPTALGKVIERRRQIEVSLRGGTFESLSRDVRGGSLDFFLGVAPGEGVNADLAVEPLYTDELQIVARPGHPLAARTGLTLADLAEHRWILSTSDGPLTGLLRESFAAEKVAFPTNPIVIEPLSSMRGLLQSTDLVAAVTRVRLREELELGQLIALPVKLANTCHVVSIVRRDEPYITSWAKELIVMLRHVARELGLAVPREAVEA